MSFKAFNKVLANDFKHYERFSGCFFCFYCKEEKATYYFDILDTSNYNSSLLIEFLGFAEKRGADVVKYLSPLSVAKNIKQCFASFSFDSSRGKFYPSDQDQEFYILGEHAKLKVLKQKEYKESQSIKVLIVDDSPTIRKILRMSLENLPKFNIVAETGKPSEVEKLIQEHQPDVMTLDIHMPEMTGLELLEKLMPRFYIPTVVISSIGLDEGTQVIQALELGAVDYIQKPSASDVDKLQSVLSEKLEIAYSQRKSEQESKLKKASKAISSQVFSSQDLIVLGASTGGTEAIRTYLSSCPDQIPATLIVQHIPPFFSKAFADRLNDLFPLFDIREAKDGDCLSPNQVLIAPGGKQMGLSKSQRIFICDDDPMTGHKPSVDYMFTSVSNNFRGNIVSILLTGMGKDGAAGMLKLRDIGAYTIAQDEESSVVYGMPKTAVQLGAAMVEKNILEIAQEMLDAFKQIRKKTA